MEQVARELEHRRAEPPRRSCRASPRAPEGAALTLAIVRIAGSMKLDTIAEGVESVAQVDELTRMGCYQAQGFHFARPMDAVDMRQLVVGSASGAPVRVPAPAHARAV